MVQAGLLRGLGRAPTLDVKTTAIQWRSQPIVGRMLGQVIDVTALCEQEAAMPVQLTTMA